MKKLTTLFLLGTVALATPAQAELTGYFEGQAKPVTHNLDAKVATTTPALMEIAMKHKKELALSEKQNAKLVIWSDKNSKKMRALMQKTVVLEKSAVYKSLRGSSKENLLAKIDKVQALRKEIATRKIECRDHLRTVLNDKQWDNLVAIYKADHKKQKTVTH